MTLSFQSTLPCGSDSSLKTQVYLRCTFQSTLPYGSDDDSYREDIRLAPISIHAPSRERRIVSLSYAKDVSRFQSTLPHGSDSCKMLPVLRFMNFNPRSLTGATGNIIKYACRCGKFQSTLPRGSDLSHIWKKRMPCHISIHAPSRERQTL